ncbi:MULTISPECIES: diaminopimelate decarboxylase [unclassified Helicobacter]|uniref:diaminopimelate decarboxylase n=1 Tax=unclassified Helicobacter TaxID=2593540 RepID=UPI0009ED74CA|nr:MULTISPECIES: diaminopimelate decarboxylase [unclassified Helicobacter]
MNESKVDSASDCACSKADKNSTKNTANTPNTSPKNATLKTLASTYGTPLYVYDLESIERNFLDFKQAFSGRKSLICYALKANSNLSILRLLASLGSGADCVSIGEVRRAMLANIPKYKIIFSGVGKKDEEIKEALERDILFLNVESYEELLRIESIAKGLFGGDSSANGAKKSESSAAQNPAQKKAQNTAPAPNATPTQEPKKARISIRVNPNIDPKTHPYISTGLHENKFGVDIENAKQMYLYAHHSDFLEPVGIHFHIGSQLTELEPIRQSAMKIADLARSLVAIGIPLRFFDIGGGVGIRYKDENPIKLYDYAQSVLGALSGCDWTIICEPGRRVVGESGVLLASVIGEKKTATKRFVIVDAGMNDLMRPALYHAYHHLEVIAQEAREVDSKGAESSKVDSAKIDSGAESSQKTLADIVGPVCESSDTFCKDIALPTLKAGDIIAFQNAGAYGYSMASSYNSRARPAEVAIYKQEVMLIKPRESFEKSVQDELDALESSAKTIENIAKNHKPKL